MKFLVFLIKKYDLWFDRMFNKVFEEKKVIPVSKNLRDYLKKYDLSEKKFLKQKFNQNYCCCLHGWCEECYAESLREERKKQVGLKK